MSEGTDPVPPRLVKGNLRRLVGGHVRAGQLGHYLDFDVVVIPPGRHVTEFPTADAAFHPYENEAGLEKEGEVLEIRIVPWIVFKISANEALSKKLAVEIGSFWRAGVENIWEIRAWNRTLALHTPGSSSRVFSGTSRFPACPVLPGLSGNVEDLFAGGEDDDAIPQGVGAEGESWRISQKWERKGESRLGKTANAEFIASPNSGADVFDPYRREEVARGFRGVAELVLGSWSGRLILGALALVLLTTTIYLILETRRSSRSRPKIEVAAPGTFLSPEARIELAKATVRAYFQTDDPAERLELVRHPEATRPRILRYYDEAPVRQDVISVFGSPTEYRVDGHGFLILPTYIEGRQTDIFLEEIGESGFLVDWESEIGYNETRFPVFRTRAEPAPTEFRVYATESDHYAGSFSSTSHYFSVHLQFPESGESAMGYMARDATDFPELEKLVTGQYRSRLRLVLDMPAVRRISPEDGESLPEGEEEGETSMELPGVQVRIVGVAGESWLSVE